MIPFNSLYGALSKFQARADPGFQRKIYAICFAFENLIKFNRNHHQAKNIPRNLPRALEKIHAGEDKRRLFVSVEEEGKGEASQIKGLPGRNLEAAQEAISQHKKQVQW